LPSDRTLRNGEKKGVCFDPFLKDGCPRGEGLAWERPGKGVSVEVAADKGGDRGFEWKGQEWVKGVGVRWDVVIET
jgi:hypothetical protein